MKIRWWNRARQVTGLGLALAAITVGVAAAADTGGTLEIKLGTTISRSWADVKKDDYAYGPKQKYEVDAQETHVYLPYGSKGVYYETTGVKLTDPAPGTPAMMLNGVDGQTCVRWSHKLHFDKPIGGFRMFAQWAELGLKNAVAGVEYSVDGQKWLPVKETDKSEIVNQFLPADSFKATGLKTQDLYIRFYSRDKDNPKASRGQSVWFKLRISGDPSWGDASTTFFKVQPQLWVTPAE